MPGITADLSGEGDGIKIKIRGIDNQRYMGEKPGVAIVIDGVPVFERTGKVNIDLDNIESIRVVKGGASYLFGEDALSGAVIITTKRGGKNAGTTLELDAGAYGYTRKLLKLGLNEENFAGHLQFSDRHNDGYYAFSKRDAKTLSGNIQYYINDNSDFSFGFEKTERFRDRSGTVSGVTASKNDPKSLHEGRGYTRMFNVDLTRLNLSYSNDFSDTGNFKAIVYQYEDITDFWSGPINYNGTGAAVGDDQVNMYQNLNDYQQIQRGLKLETRNSFGNWALMGGLEFKKNTFDEVTTVKEDYRTFKFGSTIAAGTIKSDSYREEITKAAYTEAKLAVSPDFDITMNYRFDQIDMDGKNRLSTIKSNDTFNMHSFRLGGDYEVSPTSSIYSSISTGFRTPTLSEMSTNSSLEPETTYNLELGLRNTTRLFGWKTKMNTSAFYIDRSDFITDSIGQYVNGKVTNQYSDLEDIYDNIGQTTSYGLELALQTEKKHNLSFDFAYTFLISKYGSYDDFYLALGNPYGASVNSHAALVNPSSQVYFEHYDNSGNYVPRTPTHSANFRTNWYATNHLTLSGEVDYRGESYADEINQEKMPSRVLFNLGLDYKTKAKVIGGKPSDLSFFIKVDNVLDDQFYSIMRGTHDANKDGIYNKEDLSIIVDPGRVWTTGIKVKF